MYRILLVDDEIMITNGLLKLICWEDYGLEAPDTAQSGRQALKLFQQQPYDILITDIRMPEMSGLELLERIHSAGYRTKSIVLSGYEDFHYVKQALHAGIENYLLKPVNEQELSATLLHILDKLEGERSHQRLIQSSSDTLFDNVIYRWAQREIERAELRERARLLNIRLGASLYQVSIVSLPTATENKFQQLQRVRSLLANRFAQCQDLYLAATPHYDLIVLRCGEDHFDCSRWKKELMAALSVVSDEVSWFLAVGLPVQGYFAVSDSYDSAKEMLSYSLFMPTNVCVDAGSERRYLSPQLQKELDFASLSGLLDSGDSARACTAIRRFFERLQARPGLSPENLRSILLQALKRIFDTRDPDYWRQNPALLNLYDLLNCRNLPEIGEDLCRIAAAYMRFQEEKEGGTRLVAERIMRYIEQNYEKELSLKTIAADLHYTPAYLGKIFKQAFSALFSEYLCQYRIEKAKQLLQQESYKLNEIAVMTGFQSANYFSSVFKRVVGMSPSQYRSRALPSPAKACAEREGQGS